MADMALWSGSTRLTIATIGVMIVVIVSITANATVSATTMTVIAVNVALMTSAARTA